MAVAEKDSADVSPYCQKSGAGPSVGAPKTQETEHRWDRKHIKNTEKDLSLNWHSLLKMADELTLWLESTEQFWLPCRTSHHFMKCCKIYNTLGCKDWIFKVFVKFVHAQSLCVLHHVLACRVVCCSTHTQHIWRQELCCCRPGHMFGTACQHSCVMRTLLTTVSGVNLRCIGFIVLAECRKRRLNQGSFVFLYFNLSALFDLYLVFACLFSCTVFVFSYCMFIFLYCVVSQYQSSDWLWRQPPKWPILCQVGR